MSQLDTKALSSEVAGTINRALTPLLERLAVAEAELRTLRGVEQSVTAVRERVLIAETKAAAVQAPREVPDIAEALAPLVERLTAAETRLDPLDGVRDRLVAVETKCCGIPTSPDASAESRLVSALERLSTLEYALNRAESHEAMIADLKARLAAAEAVAGQYAELAAQARQLVERVTTIEAKAAAPSIAEPLLNGLTSRVQLLEQRVIEDPAMKECAAMRERVAVVEMRAGIPGPAGPAGKDGRDGIDGKAGADGLGFDDLDVEFDGDRTITIKAARGHLKKSWPITLPFMRQKGVFAEGSSYDEGDVVTWGGSQWHCSEPTNAKPGEGSKAWTLVVKRGRDGKDGKDAPGALPVVTVGGRG